MGEKKKKRGEKFSHLVAFPSLESGVVPGAEGVAGPMVVGQGGGM